MKRKTNSEFRPVGLIGLGLMGQGIATCLLANGVPVVAYNRTARRFAESVDHIDEALEELVRRRFLAPSRLKSWRKDLVFVHSLDKLHACPFVIESVKEDIALKHSIFDELEEFVQPHAVIASNTSSLPITMLQQNRRHPERFVGMHWGEPAQISRYLEIIPGQHTSSETIALTSRLGGLCRKEPTVLNFDIQGFISNRLMYAMMREACHLAEAGVADIETIDRSFRNDIGWWSTLAGPFRWMDLTGIPAYAAVMEGLLPKLCNCQAVPATMRKMVDSGALGTANRKGFYKYTRAGAKEWERAWVDFTYDIRRLVEKYERRVKL